MNGNNKDNVKCEVSRNFRMGGGKKRRKEKGMSERPNYRT
jgi:hypothetical protein